MHINEVARRFAINCGQGEILVRTSVGYVLCAATDYAVLACLIETGELEWGTRLLIQRFLKPGDVFVDVGANLGMHTLAAARAMQGRGRIIAFEPYKPTKLLLEKSVWINGFSEITEIHQAAVSNTIGLQKLFLGATSGHHSLYPLDVSKVLSSKPVEVPLVRLDGVLHAGEKVDLIKIDAEGAELEVLESATELINRSIDVALIVEFGPSHLKRTGHTTQEWLGAFTARGLSYQAINSDTGVLEDWSLQKLGDSFSVNLFFARKGSNAWARATA
jgi:FkbM family methyltransferase